MNHDDAESRTDQSSEEVAACAEFTSILIDAYLAQLQTPAVQPPLDVSRVHPERQ